LLTWQHCENHEQLLQNGRR